MSLERLFPEAVEAGKVEHAEDWVAIEENGQTYYLPLANLSEREKALLALQNDGILEDKVTENPWYRYLIQDDLSVAKDLIDDVLPTLESDFGIKLTIFFGNVWCKFQADDLPAFYREESRLFTNMRYFRGNERTVSFSQMLLLAYAHQLDLPAIKHKMLQAIDDSKDIRPIIMTMWQEQDNLAKTAQSLYIHRNSLHYKIEKFRLLSGLNLKNLSDLAFSYLLIMEN